jgi:hypothetical protein
MTQREQLVAYLATLGALILVLLSALVTAAIAPDVMGKIEAFGLGTITGGLIGVLRLPAQRQVTIDNPPSNPVQTEEAK